MIRKIFFVVFITYIFGLTSGFANEVDQFSDWVVTTKLDKMMDTTKVEATIKSIDKVKDPIGFQKNIIISMVCKDDQIQFLISQPYFFIGPQATIMMRFDGGQPEFQQWSLSADYRMIYLKDSLSFLEKLAKHKKLILGLLPSARETVAVEFNLQETDKVVDLVERSCVQKQIVYL